MVTINEVPYRGQKLWSHETAKAAVFDVCAGSWERATDLCTSMQTDAAYSAAISKRVNGLIRTPLTFDCSSAAVRTKLQKVAWQMLPEVEVSALLTWYLGVGAAPATYDIIDDPSTGWRVPCLRTLTPRGLKYDQYRCMWTYRTRDAGTVELVPGKGGAIIMSTWRAGLSPGYVCSLGQTWVDKCYALSDYKEYNSRHAWPTVHFDAPNNTTDEQLLRVIGDWQSTDQTRCLATKRNQDESGWTVTPMTGDSAKHECFTWLIDNADRKMQIAILGGNLSSEVASSGGNRAAAETHHGVEREFVAGDAQVLTTTLHDQLISVFLELNDIKADVWPRWDVSTDDALERKAASLNSFAQFYNAMGDKVANISEIAQQFGVQLTQPTTPASDAV